MTRTKQIRVVILSMSMMLFACASATDNLFPPGPDEPSRTIYLVSHGWHAGIVVKRKDIPAGIWPQHNEFPEAEFLEVGWGDKDYYMTVDPGLGILLKAGLLPTSSVLHVVGFDGPVTDYFPRSQVIAINLSPAGFERLSRYIERSYAHGEKAPSQPLGPSLYGDGRFYLSRETYHVFNTCNAWTARALREAGCPITPAANLRVKTLMERVTKFGRVIQTPDQRGEVWHRDSDRATSHGAEIAVEKPCCRSSN